MRILREPGGYSHPNHLLVYPKAFVDGKADVICSDLVAAALNRVTSFDQVSGINSPVAEQVTLSILYATTKKVQST
jgi:hypothetical protein